MSNFVKIDDWKSKAKRVNCRICKKALDKDYYKVEAHFKIKRDCNKFMFCSLECLSKWVTGHLEEQEQEDKEN